MIWCVPPAKEPSAKPAATIVEATAKTRSVIKDLQARLTGALPPQKGEPVDDLERELRDYFERAAPSHGTGTQRNQLLNELRNRVIEGVVDRIIAEWSTSKPNAPHCLGLGREVMDRLVERVLQELRKTVAGGSPHVE